MAEYKIIKVHVTLTENKSEIFYHRMLTNIDGCLKTFKTKFAERYHVLKHSRFEVAWIDDDGDKIIILDEDDFNIFLEMKRATVLVQVDFNSTENPTQNNFSKLSTGVVKSNLNTVPDSVGVDLVGKKVDRRRIFRLEPPTVNTIIEINGKLMTPEQASQYLIQAVRDPTSGPDQPSKVLQILKSNPAIMVAFNKQSRAIMLTCAGRMGPKQPVQLPQIMGQQQQQNQKQVELAPNRIRPAQNSMLEQPGLTNEIPTTEVIEKSDDCLGDAEEVASSKKEQTLEKEEIPSIFSFTSEQELKRLTKEASDKKLAKIPVVPNTSVKLVTFSPVANKSTERSTVTNNITNICHEKQTDRSSFSLVETEDNSASVTNTLMIEKESDSSSNVEVLRDLSFEESKRQQTAEAEGVAKIPILSKCITFSVDDISLDEKEIGTDKDPEQRRSYSEDSSLDEEEIATVEKREQKISNEEEKQQTSATKASEVFLIDDSSDEMSTESDYSSSFEVLQCDSFSNEELLP